MSAEDIQRFALTLISRYLAEADRLGITVSANGQDISLVGSLPRTIRYITKSGVRANGHDSLSRLWADVQAGDADALAMVHDLEGAAYRRRAWTTTGVCKLPPELDDLLAAGALGLHFHSIGTFLEGESRLCRYP